MTYTTLHYSTTSSNEDWMAAASKRWSQTSVLQGQCHNCNHLCYKFQENVSRMHYIAIFKLTFQMKIEWKQLSSDEPISATRKVPQLKPRKLHFRNKRSLKQSSHLQPSQQRVLFFVKPVLQVSQNVPSAGSFFFIQQSQRLFIFFVGI